MYAVMFTPSDVVAYLIARGLASAAAVVDGGLYIEDVSRRNRNFKVVCRQGPSYLVKQGIGPEEQITLAHEAAVYAYFLSAGAALLGHLPRFYDYDSQHHILILELLPHAHDLHVYHARCRRFPAKLGVALGTALAALHQLPVTSDGLFARREPWALALHQPNLTMLEAASSANLQLIAIVQRAGVFGRLLDDLRASSQAHALVHFDLKWENCLISGGTRPTISLVDWELAGLGDPDWDVGSLLGAYLCAWLMSIPENSSTSLDDTMALARYPLERMQPMIHALWQTYVQQMPLDDAIAYTRLRRIACYAAARLLQTAFEYTRTRIQLTQHVVGLVQLSLNILQQPDAAIAHLFGIPLGFARYR
jgi:hypothetical protein